ncbi:MAG: undecaprenyl-diphosphate phosphatase [Trueperaceae bacterium]|nr:MAG: undecaprenyl-diphosphate phosphatase [Trueperaceae bacterium]
MSVSQAAILGVVQGLTEFLPISSSGHLVLANYYLGWGEVLPLYVDIATNTGTLLAVLFVFRFDVWTAAQGFFRGIVSQEARRQEGWNVARLVLVGSLPTALIGLALKGGFERLNAPVPVSVALLATGFLLWFTPKPGTKDRAGQLSLRDALIAGVAQGLAVIPGISRSGVTIASLLWRGASSELAPRLSFLMYLTVSVGVAFLGLGEFREANLPVAPLLVMTIASFLSGYVALLWLFSVLRKGRFRWFAPYLWGVGLLTLAHVYLR